MDPNAALVSIRELVSLLVDSPFATPQETELAELVQGLDEWLTRGGFLPTAWERRAKHPTSV
jgi:hypothetical protein